MLIGHSITSYSKATPSSSFSLNHFSAASSFANTFKQSSVTDCGVGIDIDQNSFH
jgi:hypothetical protein